MSSEAPFDLLGLPLNSVLFDLEYGTVALQLLDGRRFATPLPPDVDVGSSRIAAILYRPPAGTVEVRTTSGERVLVEVPGEEAASPDARPIVYLDQNHWSTLAKVIYEPNRVQEAERRAAERVIQAAQERRIRVPLSSAHLAETCKWRNGEARYRLALTMLQLSHGWQLRDPLDLRLFEIRQAFEQFRPASVPHPVPRAVTIEPDVIYGESRRSRTGPTQPLSLSVFAWWPRCSISCSTRITSS